ncbi:MAG: hypothetical protein V3U03_06155 [Myxococcota bacterium]
MAGSPGGRVRLDQILFGVLIALSIGGIAVTDFSGRFGLRYWLAMVPLFAAVSVFGAWSRARSRGESVAAIVRVQAAHWLALLLAVYLVNLLQATGRLTRDDAGLVALLALALTTFLAGVHFDWRMCLLGALLGLTVACAALLEQFFWWVLIPVAAAAALGLLWKRRSAPTEPGPATQQRSEPGP